MESQNSKTPLPCSFVNEYQLALLEADDGKSTQDTIDDKRIEICFKTFDEIIPKLGIFQKVIKAIRDDLFNGVYSNNYTSSQGAGGLETVARIPYFKLVKRLNEKRDEKADALYAQIHELEARHQDFMKTIDERDTEISKLKMTNDELREQIKEYESSLNKRKETINKLQHSLEKQEQEYTDIENDYKEKVNRAKVELQACQVDSKALRIYKESYDELKEAFENPYICYQPTEFSESNLDAERNEYTSPRIEQIQKDLLVMEKLENQLQFVRNCAIEEYENVLENSKKRFEDSQSSIALMELGSITSESELERESQSLVRAQRTFSEAILDIKAELTLLLQHRNLLQVELERLERDDENKKEARKNKKGTAHKSMNDVPSSIEELDLVEIMVGNTDDPFVPHENILNKYASMVYTSCNEGKTFYEIPDAAFCESCGVKTLICPHLVTERERVFSLPKHCTHIKVVRPKIKSTKKRKSRQKSESRKIYSTRNDLLPRFKLVWENLASKSKNERKLKRVLSEQFLLSIIDQFYALVLWQDEYQATGDELYSILDSFYYFLQDRYILDDAVHLVFHDILCSVEISAAANMQVHLFAACMDGTVDAAVFRYLLLMNEFICSFIWVHMQDFTTFLAIVYPFLTEDDLEQLRMGYTSFSENKVSPFLVFNYILYMVLNNKEPRFLEFESKLLQCPVRKPGCFTEIEFIEALDTFVPLAAERLLQRLFLQSVKHFPESEEAVSSNRISHITGYLSLIHESPRIINSIRKSNAKTSMVLAESAEANDLHSTTSQGSKHPSIATISKAKLLGVEMARRAEVRKSYQEQQRLASEFDDISSHELFMDEI